MYNDDGFEFFNGDIQQQYFNYYMYTEMTDDDPYGLFEDDAPQQRRSSPYRSDEHMYPRQADRPYENRYQGDSSSQRSVGFSTLILCLALIFYIVLMLIVMCDLI